MTPTLSVVVITRNEEAHIERCLQAALAATGDIEGCEIVVVDSDSSDRTVEIAAAYPVRVIRLCARCPLSPALGRYVGTRATSSRHVLFIDGDTTIVPGWVPAAVAFLDRRADAASVAGREDQMYYDGSRIVGTKGDYFGTGDAEAQVPQLGGNAMYRRVALEDAGGFNPFVRSFEEAELGARIRRAGWTLIRVPVMMAQHHTQRPDAAGEYWRRLTNHLLTGQGQVLRLSLGTPMFWEHVRTLNRLLVYIGWMLLGAALVGVSLSAATVVPVSAWAAASVILLVALTHRTGGLRKAVGLLVDWSFCSPPLIWGFLLRPRHAREASLADLLSRDSPARVVPTTGNGRLFVCSHRVSG